uniref:U46-Sparatoxin-Hju1a_1 n=1 Tax=Heteropoda jugulans TaxID=1358901 RepID=A0A4Q8K956_9ARAC
MKTLLLSVFGVALIVSCLALDCPECNRDICKDPGPCRFGQTTDACGCCPVCYKGVGEECGGPWNVFGLCANHLSCIRLSGEKDTDPIREFNAVGKCLALPK